MFTLVGLAVRHLLARYDQSASLIECRGVSKIHGGIVSHLRNLCMIAVTFLVTLVLLCVVRCTALMAQFDRDRERFYERERVERDRREAGVLVRLTD